MSTTNTCELVTNACDGLQNVLEDTVYHWRDLDTRKLPASDRHLPPCIDVLGHVGTVTAPVLPAGVAPPRPKTSMQGG